MIKKIFFKKLFLFALFLQASDFLFAQTIYFNLGVGNNFPAGQGVIGTSVTFHGNASNYTEQNIYGSYGEGFNLVAGLGYMFNAHIGAELGFSILYGNDFTAKYSSSGSTTVITSQMLASIMRFTPAMKLSLGEAALKPYAKFGLVIGVNPQMEEIATANNSIPFSEREKISGGSSVGWLGAMGAALKVSEAIAVFAELDIINQTWAPGKDEWIIESTNANGNYGVESGTTVYADIVSYPVAQSPFFKVPLKQLKQELPFGSIGINAGALFSFGQRTANK